MSKNVLIVAAHPDDEVLGCFATVKKLIQSGWSAYTLILSGGKTSRGNVSESELDMIAHEMHAANALIGVKQVFKQDFPDNAFDSVPLLSIVKAIEQVKSEVSPDLIITHHSGDMNVDHQLTHKAVLTATRPMVGECVKTILAMEVPSSTEWNSYSRETAFVPNVFVDVAETIDDKVSAMGHYASELRPYPHPRSLQYIKELASINGKKVGLEYAENFILVRDIRGE